MYKYILENIINNYINNINYDNYNKSIRDIKKFTVEYIQSSDFRNKNNCILNEKIFQYSYKLSNNYSIENSFNALFNRSVFNDIFGYHLFFINGNYVKTFSHKNKFIIKYLNVKDNASYCYLKNYKINNDILVLLNTLFNNNYIVIDIDKDVNVNRPIFIHNIYTNINDYKIIFPKKIIIVNTKYKVNIVETFEGKSNFPILINDHTSLLVNENTNTQYTRLYLIKDNIYHTDNIYIEQKSNSSVITNMIEFNNEFLYNKLHFDLNGENCNSNINGIYTALQDNTYINNYVNVNHIKPNNLSNQLYKGILDNKGKSVFTGKIKVFENAIKTLAYQYNANILLNDDSHAYIKPILEIFTDDVKCSHGATSDSLDLNMIFYLNSRGINYKKAIYLLLIAYINEIVFKLDKNLQDKLISIINKYL